MASTTIGLENPPAFLFSMDTPILCRRENSRRCVRLDRIPEGSEHDRFAALYYVLFSFMIANTAHEFGHAYAADLLGDDRPVPRAGYHLIRLIIWTRSEPVLIFVSAFSGGLFGWGRPVIRSIQQHFRNPRLRYSGICGRARL